LECGVRRRFGCSTQIQSGDLRRTPKKFATKRPPDARDPDISCGGQQRSLHFYLENHRQARKVVPCTPASALQPEETTMNQRLKRGVFKLSALVISTTLVLLLCELVTALFFPSSIVSGDILGRERSFQKLEYQMLQEEGVDYHDWAPKQEGYLRYLSDFNFYYYINSLSLRNKEIAIEDDAQFRILVLGDSQTFGYGVGQDDTFCAQLEHLLHDNGHKNTRVLNGGVTAYGTFEEYWKLKRIIHEIKPHVVLEIVFVDNVLVPDGGNDLWNNHATLEKKKRAARNQEFVDETRLTRRQAKLAFLTKHSHLYNLLSAVKNNLFEPSYTEQVRKYRLEKSQGPELASMWDTTRSLLVKMNQLAQDTCQAKFVIGYLPTLASLELDDKSSLQELEKTGLPVVSLFEPLQKIRNNDSMSLRFPHERHYNEKANKALGEALAAYFLSHDLAGPKQ
jgi:lysophospholipase L1-like esterase